MPLFPLIAALLFQVAIPPGVELEPTEEEAAYQQRLQDYDHCVAQLHMLDGDGREMNGIGVFIAPDELVAPFELVRFAEQVDIQRQCYGAYEVTHVLGGDLSSGVLILRVAPVGEPGEHELAPVALAAGEIDTSHVEALIGPMQVRGPDGAALGMVAPSFYATDATWVHYAGEPRRLRVPWGQDELDTGAPIFDAEGRLAGLTVEWDGNMAWLVATADQVRDALRFEPVAFDQFQRRELSDAERALQLRVLSGRDRHDGDYQKAAERCREAVAIAAEDWRAWFFLGVALDMAGQPVEALRALLRSHEIEPACAETLYSTGVTLARMGHGGAATHYYNAAIERDPRHAWAYANLVGPALGSGRGDLAAAHARRAVEFAPRDGRYAQMLERLEADLQANQQRLAEAEAADGQDFPALIELADLRWATGAVDQALQAAAAAEQVAPGADELLAGRGRRLVWLVSLGRYDEATALAVRSAEDLAGHPQAGAIEPFIRDQVELAQGRLDSILEEAP